MLRVNEFVESLNDSVKIREKYLNELINEVDAILYPAETFGEWQAKQLKFFLDWSRSWALLLGLEPYELGVFVVRC